MASFRFLHAADIHLDSPLKGLANQDGGAAERIRTATREAFDQLVSLTIEEQVDFLIIAGDLYDGDWRDYKTGLFFTGQMGRLRASNIPSFLHPLKLSILPSALPSLPRSFYASFLHPAMSAFVPSFASFCWCVVGGGLMSLPFLLHIPWWPQDFLICHFCTLPLGCTAGLSWCCLGCCVCG